MAEAEAELQAGVSPSPARGRVVDRAIGWLERLPGTGIPWILTGVVVLALFSHAASWLAGA